MNITDEMVDYIAELSRLGIDDGQRESLVGELDTFLSYVDKLNDLDTSGVEAMSHVQELKNVFRKDEVLPSTDRELLLREAPRRDEESFVVPRTVE